MHVKKIQSLQFKVKSSKGFTLVEMLVSITLMATLGTIVVGIFLVGLRGARKADTINVIQQNGQYAIDQIVKTVRFGKYVQVSPDNVTYTPLTSCVGAPKVANKYMALTALDDTKSIYFCDETSAKDIGVITNGKYTWFLDNSANGVNLVPNSCSFSCTQQTTSDPPQITVQFSLKPATGSNLVESNTVVPFQTTITLRNFPQ